MMRIRYAVSTMVFWWREHHLSLEQECEYLKSLGFGVELWPTLKGHNECRYQKRRWLRLREATKGMLVSLHSRNDGPTLEEWNEQIECAEMLGANIVTDLPSLCVSDELGIADWGFGSEVVKIADQHKVTLAVETGSLNAIKQLGDKFDSIRYCLDTGVSNLDPQFTFKNYVDALAERIVHLHLTDNYGRRDDHEPPGLRGGIPRENWDYLLNALSKSDNDVIGSFEMFPCMPEVMIRQASEFMFDILKWPDPPKKQPGYENVAYTPQ